MRSESKSRNSGHWNHNAESMTDTTCWSNSAKVTERSHRIETEKCCFLSPAPVEAMPLHKNQPFLALKPSFAIIQNWIIAFGKIGFCITAGQIYIHLHIITIIIAQGCIKASKTPQNGPNYSQNSVLMPKCAIFQDTRHCTCHKTQLKCHYAEKTSATWRALALLCIQPIVNVQ